MRWFPVDVFRDTDMVCAQCRDEPILAMRIKVASDTSGMNLPRWGQRADHICGQPHAAARREADEGSIAHGGSEDPCASSPRNLQFKNGCGKQVMVHRTEFREPANERTVYAYRLTLWKRGLQRFLGEGHQQ